jgi:hypothetical protein
MNEKEEVLRQISEIKNHLVDKKTFFPYNYNACFVWSIIALILTFVMIPSYQYSISFGSGLTFVLMLIGFVVERSMTKKVNQEYEIDECTKKQQFIMNIFLMISLFLIVLSTTLAIFKLFVPIYLSWLFLISIGYFAVGFILNIEAFSKIALFNMTASIVLLIVGLVFNFLTQNSGFFVILIQAIMLLGLTILPAWVAWHQKKVECSV